MEHTADFNAIFAAFSVQEEMPWPANAVGGRLDPVSTMPKMVGAGGRRNLGAGVAAGPLRIIGYIENGSDQKRLVAEPALLAESLLGPCKNRLDIALRGRRNEVAGHGINIRPRGGRSVPRPAARSGR